MRYSCSVYMDMCDLTAICRSNGFVSGIVLEKLFENKQFIKDICDEMLSDRNKYLNAIEYHNKHKLSTKRTIYIYSDCSPMDILREYGFKLGIFMSYIITNNILNDFCDELPKELKMKKFQ